MTVIVSPEPFKIELSGGEHNPYAEVNLDLCALLFRAEQPTPFALTDTGQNNPTTIAGIQTERRLGEYASITVDVASIDATCTHLSIAAHPEMLEGPCRCLCDTLRVDPTIKELTYSIRALGFGHSQRFIDEDVAYGAVLLGLVRTSAGWVLDDSVRPAIFPELPGFVRAFGIELTPFGT